MKKYEAIVHRTRYESSRTYVEACSEREARDHVHELIDNNELDWDFDDLEDEIHTIKEVSS